MRSCVVKKNSSGVSLGSSATVAFVAVLAVVFVLFRVGLDGERRRLRSNEEQDQHNTGCFASRCERTAEISVHELCFVCVNLQQGCQTQIHTVGKHYHMDKTLGPTLLSVANIKTRGVSCFPPYF